MVSPDVNVDDLLDQMSRHAEPQVVQSIMESLMDEVIKMDRDDGWFDIVGIISEVPFIVIRYQWWEPHGWHYRVISPNPATAIHFSTHDDEYRKMM